MQFNYNFDTMNYSAYDYMFHVPLDLYVPTHTILSNPSKSLKKQILTKRVLYITYGQNCCVESLKRACDAFLTYYKTYPSQATCLALNQTSIPQSYIHTHQTHFSSSKGAGYWLWKPYLIHKYLHDSNLMREGDYLFYMDAGAYLTGPINPLMVFLEKTNTNPLTFGVGLDQFRYCKRDAFIRQKCDTPLCHSAMQVNAAFSLWRNDALSRKIASEWLTDSEDYHSISDEPNIEKLDNLPGFTDHRHDQALITNVLTRGNYSRDTTNGPALFMIHHDRNKS